MAQYPQRVKFKKIQRKQILKLNKLKPYSEWYQKPLKLITMNTVTVSFKQIEAFRRVLIRKLKHSHKIHIPIIADLSSTAKPASMRMGKGKGNFKIWLSKIKAGTTAFLFKGPLLASEIKQILKKNKFNKLPCKLKFY